MNEHYRNPEFQYRPQKTDLKKFGENYDRIFRKVEDAREDEASEKGDREFKIAQEETL